MTQIYLIVLQFLDKHVFWEKMTPEICINLLLAKNASWFLNIAKNKSSFANGTWKSRSQLFSGVN